MLDSIVSFVINILIKMVAEKSFARGGTFAASSTKDESLVSKVSLYFKELKNK